MLPGDAQQIGTIDDDVRFTPPNAFDLITWRDVCHFFAPWQRRLYPGRDRLIHRHLGVTRNATSSWHTGKRHPSGATIDRMISGLHAASDRALVLAEWVEAQRENVRVGRVDCLRPYRMSPATLPVTTTD
jgi:hypothetical protein